MLTDLSAVCVNESGPSYRESLSDVPMLCQSFCFLYVYTTSIILAKYMRVELSFLKS